MSAIQAQEHRSRYVGFESVPIRVTVVVGRTQIRLDDLLALEKGVCIRLDRSVGTPFDMSAGGIHLGQLEPLASEESIQLKLVAEAEE